MTFPSLKIGVLFLIILLVGTGAYYGAVLRSDEVFVVKKQDIIEQIPIRGIMTPAENIDLGFSSDGVVAAIAVRAGDRVERDDVLAQLANAGKEAEIKNYEAKIAVEKATLAQLLSGVNRKEIDLAEAKASAADLALENARREAEDKKTQTDNDLARRYALARDYGETILLNAENAMDALRGIYDDKNAFRDIFIISESQERSDAQWHMMLARTAFANIQAECAKMKAGGSYATIDAALSNNKTNLEVIRATLHKTAEILAGAHVVFGGPDIAGFKTTMVVQRSVINATQTTILTLEQDIAAQAISAAATLNDAQKKVSEAEAAVKTADSELALKKASATDSAIAVHQAQIKEYESSLMIARAGIENSILRAPLDGVIARVGIRPGVLVKKQTSVLSLTPFSDTQVDANVSGDDVQKIHVGDAAHIIVGEKEVDGRVASVSDGAVRVHFDDAQVPHAAKEAVSGVVDAVLIHDALVIPKAFLHAENGVKTVRVKSPDGVKTVFVLPGIERNGYVEIQEGIFAGDQVVRPR